MHVQGKAAINEGWRWGWLFTGSCGPLLKEHPGQVGVKVDMIGMDYEIEASIKITVDYISDSLPMSS